MEDNDDVNNNTEYDTNKEKNNNSVVETKDIDNNDEMNIKSTVSKDNLSLSNYKIVKKVNEMSENQ